MRHELATEWLRMTGCLPFIADRHTSECSSRYITSLQAIATYKLDRTTIRERQDGMDRRARRLREMASGAEPVGKGYFKRSRERAADIIAAHSQGRPFIDVGNVPNIGQVSNLPRGSVLETAVRVDQNGCAPIRHGELPACVAGLVDPFCRAFDLNVEACFRGDRHMALQALRLNSVCAHLSWAQVQELGRRLLYAHRRLRSGRVAVKRWSRDRAEGVRRWPSHWRRPVAAARTPPKHPEVVPGGRRAVGADRFFHAC